MVPQLRRQQQNTAAWQHTTDQTHSAPSAWLSPDTPWRPTAVTSSVPAVLSPTGTTATGEEQCGVPCADNRCP